MNPIRRIQLLYEDYGEADYIGEPVSILEHGVQAAYFASLELPDDRDMIVAALFHDIGHVLGLEAHLKMGMNGCGIDQHEKLGADFLRGLGFPERVAKLVQNHVQAKRYLCFKHPEYHSQLTPASQTTLLFQGGVMSSEEAFSFENDVDFTNILLMRNFDDKAKLAVGCPRPDFPPFESYFPMIESLLSLSASKTPQSIPKYLLSPAQINFYKVNSFLLVKNALKFAWIPSESVSAWVDEVCSWPKVESKWIIQHELNADNQRVICRAENFVNFHEKMSELANAVVNPIVAQLFGEESVLFKEKINFKQPGGAGFAAHQDTPAYIGLATDHISVMVAVDAATEENGCLQVARGCWKQGDVRLTAQGVVEPEVEAQMHFEPVSVAPGDLLFFSGYIPHRSFANLSDKPRRAMFLTYNPLSQGEFHEEYYHQKHAKSHGFDSSRAISFQGDFQGVVVD